MSSITSHICIGLALRLLFIAYGSYHDKHNAVPYTDIDYSVYTDAAKYVLADQSPYQRETFRYTPILAWMLTPTLTLFSEYGKILFSLFDILTAYLIYLIVDNETGGNVSISKKSSFIWIYNPLPIVICTRGSSESIILCLVLSFLYMYLKKAYLISGLLYGFAVHFKIYPVVYCLPLYLSLGPRKQPNSETNLATYVKDIFTITPPRVLIILGTIIGFIVPTMICFQVYGMEFVEETYLYHLTRKDVKHNFSLYFYLLYLHWNNEGLILKVLSFLPQAVMVIGTSLLFGSSRKDICFTLFVQTYCFVVFNKVCTSQYFLWYLSLLPILAPKLNTKWTHAVILLVIWYFAQISWLLPAYFLEFEGRNTFLYIWLESIAFFCANVGVLGQIIKNYDPARWPEGN